MVRVETSPEPGVPARGPGPARRDRAAAPTRCSEPLTAEYADTQNPEHAPTPPIPAQRQPDCRAAAPFDPDCYVNVFHRIADGEDDGHRARVRAELERAIAKGMDVI